MMRVNALAHLRPPRRDRRRGGTFSQRGDRRPADPLL